MAFFSPQVPLAMTSDCSRFFLFLSVGLYCCAPPLFTFFFFYCILRILECCISLYICLVLFFITLLISLLTHWLISVMLFNLCSCLCFLILLDPASQNWACVSVCLCSTVQVVACQELSLHLQSCEA